MKKNLLVAVAVFLGMTSALQAGDRPDHRAALRLAGRMTTGHACPVDPKFAISAAHVMDLRPYSKDVELFPYRFESYHGEIGIVTPLWVAKSSDLGLFRILHPVKIYYKMAAEAPLIGDKVYWVEYNLDKQKKAFQLVEKDARVLYVVAGRIFFNENPVAGASGGCLWNQDGEVLGVISSAWNFGGDSYNSGEAVGVFGPWGATIIKEENASTE